MNNPNFSNLNPIVSEKRTEKVRVQMGILGNDLDLKKSEIGIETSEDKRDRYFAAMGILVKYAVEKFKNKLAEKNIPKFSLKEGDNFHDKFLEVYQPIIREIEEEFSRETGEKTKKSLSAISSKKQDKMNEIERAFISFVADDEFKKPGLSVLSFFDGLFIMVHIADLVLELSKNKKDNFEKMMESKQVKMFVNSLMINESSGVDYLMMILAKDKSCVDHKKTEFRFASDLFHLNENGEIQLRKDIPGILRKIYENNKEKMGGRIQRNCPASFAPNEANEFFELIRNELIKQVGI